MIASPTQLTLKKLRREGWTAAITEHWNPFARIRQDLFGFVDVLGIGEQGTIAVQTTSDSNLSARVKKVQGHENLSTMKRAGWKVIVHGWRKKQGKWVCREVEV